MQPTRSLYITYWVGSAVIACAAFWVAGSGPTTTHESYYATVIFSVAAVIPLALSSASPARRLIPVGVSIYFASSLAGLASGYVIVSTGLAQSAPIVTRLARENHATAGYSNFTDASGLTWGTHERVVVRPLANCPTETGVNLCPGFQDYLASWYVPRNRRTFLLIDATSAEVNALPSGLGKPLAAYAFGAMQMYIYPYDIASRLGPPTV